MKSILKCSIKPLISQYCQCHHLAQALPLSHLDIFNSLPTGILAYLQVGWAQLGTAVFLRAELWVAWGSISAPYVSHHPARTRHECFSHSNGGGAIE